MKKQKIFFGALGLLALGFTACSNENMVEPTVAQKDEMRYMRVAIANPPGTRAEFQEGLDAENKVENMEFRLYDATGKRLNYAYTITKEEAWKDNTGTTTPSVGKIKELTLEISIEQGKQYPAYIMCFINPVNFSGTGTSDTDLGSVDMNKLRDAIRYNYKDNQGNFAMNNSVYYGKDPISGASNVKMSGTPIPPNALLPTNPGDGAVAADKIIDIYVERLAAKVQFSMERGEYTGNGDDATGIKPYTTANGYDLTFVPEAWTVNADSPEMYAVKRFSDDNELTTGIPTMAQVQAMLGTWTSWNDDTNHRSYWACSPSYYAKEFPQVSDNVIEKAAEGTTGAGVLVGQYKLQYYSYNQITSDTDPKKGVEVPDVTNAKTSKYVMENTMGSAAFNCLNPSAAAPSVVLVGNYTVKNNDTDLTTADGFCLYNNNLYFKGTLPENAPEGAQTILAKLLDSNAILSTQPQDRSTVKSDSPDVIISQFEVAHPIKEVRGITPVPHRYVTLQLKKDATLNGLYYKPLGSDTYMALTTALEATYEADDTEEQKAAKKIDFINNINTILWDQIGNAFAYTENKCYFSIPIRHLGFTENTTGVPVDANGNVVWANVRVGDFGLVRNHVYDIQVQSITGLAAGIENLENPLVPSMPTNQYWLKHRINILNWRIVPTQDGIKL